jgi:hypothetical protein
VDPALSSGDSECLRPFCLTLDCFCICAYVFSSCSSFLGLHFLLKHVMSLFSLLCKRATGISFVLGKLEKELWQQRTVVVDD